MTAFRASALTTASLPLFALASFVSAPLLLAGSAHAQVADDIVLNIMRQCAQIDDATARLACYDNNIRSAGAAPRSSVPGTMSTPQGGSGAPVAAGGATGFGREDIRTPERFETPAGELEQLTTRVTSVTQQGPGMYLLTLEDGARWAFAESVDFSYRPPREGSSVTIDRASLGSFLLRFDNQKSVRVRRVR